MLSSSRRVGNIARKIWLPEIDILKSQQDLFNYHCNIVPEPKQVVVGDQNEVINYVEVGDIHDKGGNTFVLAHGYNGGLGFFSPNFDRLSTMFGRVVLFDWVGFGGSSRPSDQRSPTKEYFSQTLSTFCEKIGITEKFNLGGHSLGGYFACNYALENPETLKKLFLFSPVGLPVPPDDAVQHSSAQDIEEPKRHGFFQSSLVVKLASAAWLSNKTPGQIVRALGRTGPFAVEQLIRAWCKNREIDWSSKEIDLLSAYVYEISAQPGFGEFALNVNLVPYVQPNKISVYAREPLGAKLLETVKNTGLDVKIIFGVPDKDWIMRVPRTIETLNSLEKHVKIEIIENAGHHLYMDNAERFYELIAMEL